MDRYFVKTDTGYWSEVSLEDWCRYERNAGFHSKFGYGTPATAGFSGHGLNGRTIYNFEALDPDAYSWDPEFADFLRGLS